jgi:hypothetical protein
MKRLSWRFLITCVLLVLLPLQGFAAAGRVRCVMDFPVKSAMSSQISPDVAQTLDSTKKNTHCEPVKQTQDKTDKAGKVHGSCKSSAPCCLGIAMLPSSQRVVFSAESGDALATLADLPTSIPARTLERPPKSQFA